MDPSLAALLERGARLSVTLRSLLTELEASDVIVHVLTQRRRPYGPNGTLGFVTGVGERRYVRIGVDDRLQSSAVVALLGHELQHAVEVSRARWVVDQPSFGQLYGKIGFRACGERRPAPCEFASTSSCRCGVVTSAGHTCSARTCSARTTRLRAWPVASFC